MRGLELGHFRGIAKAIIAVELEHESKNSQVLEARNCLAQSKCSGDMSMMMKKAAQSEGIWVTCSGQPTGEKCWAQSLKILGFRQDLHFSILKSLGSERQSGKSEDILSLTFLGRWLWF